MSLVFAGAAVAQQEPGRITNTIVIKDTPLDAGEQKIVSDTVNYWIKQMATGKPEAVAAGRDRLIEPYNQAPKEHFLAYYNQIVATALVTIADSKHLITRINVQIVAKMVKNAKIAEVIKIGLLDTSSAVVYPTAQSAAALMADPNTPLELRLTMVKPLIVALQKEGSGWVLEYLYQALVDTREIPAIEAVLRKLNDRVFFHADKINGMMGAEITGIKAVSNRLTRLNFDNIKIPNDVLKLFGQALYRYADLCTQVLVENKASPNHEAAYLSMLNECDLGFDWLISKPLGMAPPKRLRGQDLKLQRLTVLQDWSALLKKKPLELTDAELAPPKPEAPKAPKAPAEVPAVAPAPGVPATVEAPADGK
ncbi:MAG: hypothetical protein WD768_02220 [Phycisphaeraceae bacterium]